MTPTRAIAITTPHIMYPGSIGGSEKKIKIVSLNTILKTLQ